MKKLILSIISFVVIASVPSAASAVLVNIKTTGCTTDVNIPLGTPTGTDAVPIAGTYGCFTISNQGTSLARVYLNVQPTYKTLVLTNAIIKNNSTLDTAVKNIEIQYKHTFTPNVPPSAQQYYSLGMSGFFKRATGTTLAAGSNVTLAGFGTFGTGDQLVEQIVNASPAISSLSHTVTSTNSFVDPTPNLKDNFSCDNVATDQDSSCPVVGSSVPTSLLIFVSLNLKGQHSLTVSSSFDSIGADNEADRDLAQALLSLPTDVQTDVINMIAQQGVIPVAILGSEDYDPTHPITGIDPLTVDFMGAFVFQGSNIGDVNFDGHDDLLLRFLARETYAACGDSLATWTGFTHDGRPAGGSDSIRVIQPPKCK